MKLSTVLKVAVMVVLAGFLVAMAPRADRDVVAEVGSPAPDFTLQDQDGNPVSLSDYSGKVVVLEWFNEDCPFVQRHYAEGTFIRLANHFKEQGVVWLTIDTTHYATRAANKDFKEKHNLPYPILSDRTGEVGRMYGAKTTPHMYIIDEGGKLVYAGGIDDDPRGDSDNRTNYVQNALEEILDGDPVAIPESKPYGCSVKYAE